MEPGIYRGTELIAAGDFTQKAGYLCVDRAIARDSAVTLFIVSDYHNYQTASQLAGAIGQRLYLASNYRNIACTGIGAYYDREMTGWVTATRRSRAKANRPPDLDLVGSEPL